MVYLNGNAQSLTITKGESVQVTASCPAGYDLIWTQGNLGTQAPIATSTYAAKCQQGTCLSEEAGQTITVRTDSPCNAPPAPTLSVNKGANITLTVSNCDQEVHWEDDLTTAERTRTVSPPQTTTYKVKCGRSDCWSAWAEVVVIVDEPQQQRLTYTGQWQLCNGAGSTPRSFVGCETGRIEIRLDNELYTNDYLVIGQRYSAVCYINNIDVSRTTFSISSAPTPRNVTISKSPNTSSIAQGGSITLSVSASDAQSFRWNTGSTETSIRVSPTSETQYSVRAYSGYAQDGCASAEAHQTISVESGPCDLPSAPAIQVDNVTIGATELSGTLTVRGCEGGIILWSTDEADATSITQEPGEYSVTCTVSNSCGINSTTVKASISRGVTQPCSTPSAPVISIDKTTVLSGDQVALTATNCSYTVNWSDGATGLSRSVNSQNSTTYTATCQNGNCTSEASNSVSITVYIWAGKFSEMQSSRPPCSIQTFQIVYSASGDITPGNTLFVNVSTTLAGGWYLVYTDNEYYTVEVNESGEVMSRRVCSQ